MLYEFGNFSLDTAKRQVTRDGEAIALPPKSFDLLLLLIESGGRALSKSELMNALWPDTFVEEANLSFQISVLRKTLGENGPKWIETVPKYGYRFSGGAAARAEENVATAATPFPPKTAREPNQWWWRCIAAAGVLVAVGVFVVIATRRQPPQGRPFTPVPLTAYPGMQTQPSLSPDGNQVAFSWNGANEDNFDIYVKLVGPGEPFRLTTNPARDTSPAWSPDGQQIAFLRFSTDLQAAIFLIPALGGGAERKLADVVLSRGRHPPTLGWSVDGKHIAVGAKFIQNEPWGIWLISTETGERRRLTTGDKQMRVDYNPVFSPRGRSLVFIRATSFSSGDLYLQQLTDDLAPAGDPMAVTAGHVRIESAAWIDENKLAYSTGLLQGLQRLRTVEIGARGAMPARNADFGEGVVDLSISGKRRLVYARQLEDVNLWRMELTTGVAARHERLIASTFNEYTPSYSPDGRKIAFASTRSGLEEIWVADSDGGHAVQVTSTGSGHTANPRWSPAGGTIVFNSWQPRSHLFALDVNSGSMQRLTNDAADDVEPSWSHDGNWIYYSSNRTGTWEICRFPTGGGPPIRMTKNGGVHAEESRDGKWLYYSKSADSPTSIWRVPTGGGEEIQVLDGLSYSTNFVVVSKGIYLLSGGPQSNATGVEYYDFATRTRQVISTIDKLYSWGIALSPDERYLLYSAVDRASSNLMLVDGFR